MKSRLLFLVVLAWSSLCHAEISVAPIFGDGMVLQRRQPLPVWGRATAGSKVTVELATARASTIADAEGKWSLRLPALEAGGPHSLTVSTGREQVVYRDVLLGEVWVCSGQSNMGMALKSTADAPAEIAAANHPRLRFFTVGRNASMTRTKDLQGRWEASTPATAAGFSAVAYFFGREIHGRLGVPVGLINSSWGGTPAEAWTRWETLKDEPRFSSLLDLRKNAEGWAAGDGAKAQAMAAIAAWEKNAGQLQLSPSAPESAWFDASRSPAGWKTMRLPGFWESREHLNIDGSVWFRRVVELPAGTESGDAELSLGPIDDFDIAWINGREVGRTGPDTPQFWLYPRVYKVPAGILRAGKNVVLVRVVDHGGNGGFAADNRQLFLKTTAGANLPLSGPWDYRVETVLAPKPPSPIAAQYVTGTLYDGMISPLIPYAIRGAIWYQGESNADRAAQYRHLFPHMISNWRADWGQGDFPFYFVQLANFKSRVDESVESDWAELREAQHQTLSLRNTGEAVAIDIGDASDIHPRNKRDVGLRLARIALARDYGFKEPATGLGRVPLLGRAFLKPIVYSGPEYRSMKGAAGKIRLRFDSHGGLAAKDGGALRGFDVAGADRNFVRAEARIDGDTVVVSSSSVPAPVAVRYAWADNPEATLVNTAGLPASPFRTDDWPGITEGSW